MTLTGHIQKKPTILHAPRGRQVLIAFDRLSQWTVSFGEFSIAQSVMFWSHRRYLSLSKVSKERKLIDKDHIRSVKRKESVDEISHVPHFIFLPRYN